MRRLTWPTFTADNDDDGYEEYNEGQDDDDKGTTGFDNDDEPGAA